jgi:hypothetical protein
VISVVERPEQALVDKLIVEVHPQVSAPECPVEAPNCGQPRRHDLFATRAAQARRRWPARLRDGDALGRIRPEALAHAGQNVGAEGAQEALLVVPRRVEDEVLKADLDVGNELLHHLVGVI